MKRDIRISFTRHEVIYLLEGLEALFDGFAPNEHHLIEREFELHNRLSEIKTKHDLASPPYSLRQAS